MNLKNVLLAALISGASLSANAGIIFSFQDNGGNLAVTSSGSIDTSGLIVQQTLSSWNGAGFGNFGNYAMMGDTTVGAIDVSFGFSAGTDFSDWHVSSGAFSSNHFSPAVNSGTTAFATYLAPSPYTPGLSLNTADLVNGIWTPDVNWTFTGASIASFGLNSGAYTVSDAQSAEFITFQIGPAVTVPEPASLVLLGLGLAGLGFSRRVRKI